MKTSHKKSKISLKSLAAVFFLLILALALFFILKPTLKQEEPTPQPPKTVETNLPEKNIEDEQGEGQPPEDDHPEGNNGTGGSGEAPQKGSRGGEKGLDYERERENQGNDSLPGDDTPPAPDEEVSPGYYEECIENCIEAGESAQDCSIICGESE